MSRSVTSVTLLFYGMAHVLDRTKTQLKVMPELTMLGNPLTYVYEKIYRAIEEVGVVWHIIAAQHGEEKASAELLRGNQRVPST